MSIVFLLISTFTVFELFAHSSWEFKKTSIDLVFLTDFLDLACQRSYARKVVYKHTHL